MSRTEFEILRESGAWIAVYKRAQTHSDEHKIKRGAFSVFSPVHRLDFETQGLLLLADRSVWERYHGLFRASPYSNSENSGQTAQSKNLTAKKHYIAGASTMIPRAHYRGFVASRYRSSKKCRYSCTKEPFHGWHSVLFAEHIVAPISSETPLLKFFGIPHHVQLLTGRRHQIRCFFAEQGAPLVGDFLYGDTGPRRPLELFSWKLEFTDPLSGETERVEAPPAMFG